MGGTAEVEPGRRLGPTRSRLLALLQDAGTAMTAHEIADRMGLHANTARFHLEALEGTGAVVRSLEDRTRPGRPRVLFAAAPGAPGAARRSYRLLAEILSGYIAQRDPQAAAGAVEVGAAWGSRLAGPVAASGPLGVDEAVATLVERLDAVGFESHSAGEGDTLRLDVHHCPFLEVAADHRDVVCSVHLGLMRGVLAQLGAPVTADTLEPLVEPSRCIAHLRLADAG